MLHVHAGEYITWIIFSVNMFLPVVFKHLYVCTCINCGLIKLLSCGIVFQNICKQKSKFG
jgi:hypothetical protein